MSGYLILLFDEYGAYIKMKRWKWVEWSGKNWKVTKNIGKIVSILDSFRLIFIDYLLDEKGGKYFSPIFNCAKIAAKCLKFFFKFQKLINCCRSLENNVKFIQNNWNYFFSSIQWNYWKHGKKKYCFAILFQPDFCVILKS